MLMNSPKNEILSLKSDHWQLESILPHSLAAAAPSTRAEYPRAPWDRRWWLIEGLLSLWRLILIPTTVVTWTSRKRIQSPIDYSLQSIPLLFLFSLFNRSGTNFFFLFFLDYRKYFRFNFLSFLATKIFHSHLYLLLRSSVNFLSSTHLLTKLSSAQKNDFLHWNNSGVIWKVYLFRMIAERRLSARSKM